MRSLQRLQHHEESALILSGISTGKSNHGVDRRIFHHDVHVALHLVAHGLKRDVLRGHHAAHDASRILLREEALGHLDVKEDAEARHQNGNDQRHRLVRQHPFQRVTCRLVRR